MGEWFRISHLLRDLLEVTASGHDGGLIHQILKICSCESWGPAGDLLKINVLGQDLASGVHLEDRHAALHKCVKLQYLCICLISIPVDRQHKHMFCYIIRDPIGTAPS